MRRLKVVIVAFMLLGVSLAYAGIDTRQARPAQQRVVSLADTQFGDPLPGLDAEELGRFNSGKAQFVRVHTPEDGLGPIFNQVSCVACHSVPTVGGSLPSKQDLVVRIGRTNPQTGKYDPLTEFGGQVLSRQSVTTVSQPSIGLPLKGCNQPGNAIPSEADFVSFRFGQPLFGLGLIEAISDDTILANADPDDKDRDGIRGRPNMVPSVHFKDTRLGRFGWKAQMPSLIDFCGDAYLVQIGITSPDFPEERHPNGKDVKPGCDLVQDPEDKDGRDVRAFVDFITFLAPPPQKPLDSSATHGKQIFSAIGCVKCHIPTLKTASNPAAGSSLANRDVPLYSDLLLHDMGDDLADGIEQAGPSTAGPNPAGGREWRTQPLWGATAKKFFLHDGRTADLGTAIVLHGGEAARSRNKYLNLKGRDQKDLLNFLKAL